MSDHRSRRKRRAWLIAAGAVAVAILALALLRVAFPTPGGPRSSSHATGPLGLAAYAELLARSGHPVTRLRERLDEAALDPADTLVLLDPQELAPQEARALRRFVAAGGRLVAGGAGPAPWLRALLERPPAWFPGGPARAAPVVPVPEIGGARSVATAGEGSWSDPGGALPALGDPDRPLLVVAAIGRGRVALIADPSPLQNRLLAEADDAALGLALAGPAGRRVVFAEAAHGYGAATGLSAIPRNWQLALVGLVLAALVAIAARWRRLGPPDREEEGAGPPARRLYVDALAAALARTRRPAEASAPLRAAARDRLARRTGLAHDADAAEAQAAAVRLGLDPEEARALLAGPADEGELLAAGRGLARLVGGAR